MTDVLYIAWDWLQLSIVTAHSSTVFPLAITREKFVRYQPQSTSYVAKCCQAKKSMASSPNGPRMLKSGGPSIHRPANANANANASANREAVGEDRNFNRDIQLFG